MDAEQPITETQAAPLTFYFAGGSSEPVNMANILIIQQNGDEFIVTIGQVTPFIPWSAEQLTPPSPAPINLITRFVLTEQRLEEFIASFQSSLNNARAARVER